MWMPDEAATPLVTGGATVLGEVYGNPGIPPARPSFWGGQSPGLILFNLRTAAGNIVRCQFEGDLDAALNSGDKVTVVGTQIQGVIHARRITSVPDGAVIGQTRCFVATVAFGDAAAPEVECLRVFRDLVLARSVLGRAAIAFYWRVGPALARHLAERPWLCRLVRRAFLTPVCRILGTWTRRREHDG